MNASCFCLIDSQQSSVFSLPLFTVALCKRPLRPSDTDLFWSSVDPSGRGFCISIFKCQPRGSYKRSLSTRRASNIQGETPERGNETRTHQMAKMQWSLFLLILMGQCSFFMCHLCEYHFISDSKTWEEARNYCRETYTDLATVYDMTDAERLSVPTGRQEGAWIGLQSHPGKENRRWHWSLPGVEHHEAPEWWADGEPNDEQLPSFENCVWTHNSWVDVRCTSNSTFTCYDESKEPGKKFYFINKSMTWPEAQSHCRKHHTDLVSGLTQLSDVEFKSETANRKTWIGLFRDTWRWSDNSSSSFRNWDLELFRDDEEQKCAVIKFNGTGKWSSDDCHEEKPFFCYEDKVVLIQQNKTWEEALNHCRENHNDLVSIINRNEQMWVRQKAKRASSPFVWLGLRYTCTLDFWFWVSDEEVSYENWASGGGTDDCDLSGAMAGGGEHKWSKKADTDKFNFICSNF